MNDKTFVDSNILIYAFDLDCGEKRDIANAALASLWQSRSGAISMQVLQEFYVNVTRKIPTPVTKAVARSVVNDYFPWCMELTTDEIAMAFHLEDHYGLSFWDALILAAAVSCGATRLLSEDLNTGQQYAGITVENPFRSRIQ